MPRRRPRPVSPVEDTAPVDVVTTEDKPVKAEKPKPRTVKSDLGTMETKEAPQPPQPKPYVPAHQEGIPNGIILEPKEAVRLEGDDDGVTVTVSRDVYRKVYPQGALRPSYVLLYPRGAKVMKSLLQRQ